jgi:GNAT superfamily N-acetyltransferase
MITRRSYQQFDYGKIPDFLSMVYRQDRQNPYWLPGRWEYAEFLVSPLYQHRGFLDWKDTIAIWENEQHNIVGVVNSENPDNQYFLHVHNAYKALETEMILWAEKNLQRLHTNQNYTDICIWACERDTQRNDALTALGYTQSDEVDFLRWRRLDTALDEQLLPDGYTLHTMQETVDLAAKIQTQTSAFQSQPYPVEIYTTMQRAPSYRPEFDLFTRDRAGMITSFCTIWIDTGNNLAYFEPVGVHPDHQRKGLGKAMLNRGLCRLKESSVAIAYVGAYGEGRGYFYNSAGFTEAVRFRPWKKLVTAQ